MGKDQFRVPLHTYIHNLVLDLERLEENVRDYLKLVGEDEGLTLEEAKRVHQTLLIPVLRALDRDRKELARVMKENNEEA